MRIRLQTIFARPALAILALFLCLSVSSLSALSLPVHNTLNDGLVSIFESSPVAAIADHRGSGRLTTDLAYRGSGRISNQLAHRGSGRLTAYRGSGRLAQQTV